MDNLLCIIVASCLICLCIFFLPIQSQSMPTRPRISARTTSARAQDIQARKRMVPNRRHAEFIATKTGASENRKAETTAVNVQRDAQRAPLHDSYVFVKNEELSLYGDSTYSKVTINERLSNEAMTRNSKNIDYTSALTKFIRYQEQDFLNTVKVGDPNVRPIGGSFGCKPG